VIRLRIATALLTILLIALAGSRLPSRTQNAGGSGSCSWEVYFSPPGGGTAAVVKTINSARKTVLVQAYCFTSAPIAKALLNARKRRVDVRVILDKGQVTQRYSSASFFTNVGVPARIDSAHAIAHNKVMIVDGSTVITGSFNFTRAAEERNAENLLIIRDKSLAAVYTRNWKSHEKHSRVLKMRN
jgi:phosphatidylserine/phosphatidylglycerophosphate/cardiolipin synthase-like enzyme